MLELGGKDAIVAFDDADYSQLVDTVMRTCFQNSGQNCAGLERLIVQEGIHDRLMKDLTVAIGSLVVGPPMEGQVDIGAMTMATQVGLKIICAPC